MLSFLGKKTRLALVLHIGSHSVAGAFVRYEKDVPPLLRTSVRVALSECDSSSPSEQLHRAFKKALAELMERILKESAPIAFRADKRASPEEIYVSCSSPWQRVSVYEHTIREEDPFTITKAHIVDAAKKALPETKENDEHMVIHRSVLQVRVNGYQVHRPLGKKAHNLTVSSLVEEVRADVHEEVVRALEVTFHKSDARFRAFASVSYHAISKLFPYEHNYIFMEVAGTATTAAFVREGVLQTTEMVDFGINDSREDKASWSLKVSEMLERVAGKIPIPQTVFLATHNPHREAFVKALKDVDTLKIRLGSRAFTVIPIQDGLLREHIIYGSEASPDFFLALSSLLSAPSGNAQA